VRWLGGMKKATRGEAPRLLALRLRRSARVFSLATHRSFARVGRVLLACPLWSWAVRQASLMLAVSPCRWAFASPLASALPRGSEARRLDVRDRGGWRRGRLAVTGVRPFPPPHRRGGSWQFRRHVTGTGGGHLSASSPGNSRDDVRVCIGWPFSVSAASPRERVLSFIMPSTANFETRYGGRRTFFSFRASLFLLQLCGESSSEAFFVFGLFVPGVLARFGITRPGDLHRWLSSLGLCRSSART